MQVLNLAFPKIGNAADLASVISQRLVARSCWLRSNEMFNAKAFYDGTRYKTIGGSNHAAEITCILVAFN